MSRTGALATILTIVLIMPTTIATWYAYGSHEPDSAYDDASYMWTDPPGLALGRVYFDVFTTQGTLAANPNVGVAQTRFETFGAQRHEAILGVWVDCNQDGYVGMIETALREYSSRLLLDDSVCPAVEGPTTSWIAGAHNYNGWITELVPIGPHTYGGDMDKRWYPDEDAKIWGDHGLPDGSGLRPSCALTSFPPGGSRSTGRILDHTDCYLALLVDERSAVAYKQTYDEAVGATGLDPLGLGLRSEQWAQSGHPLDKGTFGDADTENTYLTVHDCDPDYVQLTGDVPVGSDLDNLWMPALDPNPNTNNVNTDGSIAATVIYAKTLIIHEGASETNGVCGRDDIDDNEEFYSTIEGNDHDVYTSVKDAPNWNFRFYRSPRGAGLAGVNPVLTDSGGAAGAPADLGVEHLPLYCSSYLNYDPTFCIQTRWYASAGLRALPSAVRIDIPSSNVALADAYVMTFYAGIGAATTDRGFLPPAGTATSTYGAATCGENDRGVHNGWQCDASLWYPESYCPDKPLDPPPCMRRPRPGTAYSLRDIDCYDGGIGDTGLFLMPAGYGERPCP